MTRVNKIVTIIITAILTVSNLWQILPDEAEWKSAISAVISPILAIPIMYSIIGSSIFLLGLLVIFLMIYELKNEKKIHTFKVGSFWFRHFFKKWYSKPGTLSVICDDLDGWVVVNDNKDIFSVLLEKSKEKQLHLILGKQYPKKLVDELKRNGATVHSAPKDIILNYSFSCLSVMGNNATVIIRNKQKDENGIIRFEEISNTYVTGLLNSLIKNIEGDNA